MVLQIPLEGISDTREVHHYGRKKGMLCMQREEKGTQS